MGVRLALTIGVAFVAQRVLFAIAGRAERLIDRTAVHHGEQGGSRARTLGQVMRSLITAVIIGAAIVHSLEVLGWDVRPLLAGAGILGVALGFGAQSLVRDWISDVYILLENQYIVGDVIEVGGSAATVERITLRSTRLRDFNGYLHFVPNGEMKTVTNRSRGWHRVAVDVPLHTSEDIDRALERCRAVVAAFNADAKWSARMLEPVQLWGVESLGAGDVNIRMVARTNPGADGAEVARELRRRVLQEFHSVGIRYPVAAAAVGRPNVAPGLGPAPSVQGIGHEEESP
jgi:small conductance mechanosensitive channel